MLADNRHEKDRDLLFHKRQLSPSSSLSSGYYDDMSGNDSPLHTGVLNNNRTILSRPPLQSTRLSTQAIKQQKKNLARKASSMSRSYKDTATPTDVTFTDKINWDDTLSLENLEGSSATSPSPGTKKIVPQNTNKVAKYTGITGKITNEKNSMQRPPDWWYDISRRPSEYAVVSEKKRHQKY